MPVIKKVRGKMPKFGNNVFIAENATIVGEVECGDDCSFWFNAVVRGDVHYIKMGNKVNVQDNVCIHATFEKSPTTIGNSVSIGHNAIVHGCTIEDNVLVGMGAIIMDDAYIERNSIIAAGAVVLERTRVASGTIFAGTPAKQVKEVSEEHVQGLIERISNNYVKYAGWFKDEDSAV